MLYTAVNSIKQQPSLQPHEITKSDWTEDHQCIYQIKQNMEPSKLQAYQPQHLLHLVQKSCYLFRPINDHNVSTAPSFT